MILIGYISTVNTFKIRPSTRNNLQSMKRISEC